MPAMDNIDLCEAASRESIKVSIKVKKIKSAGT